MTGSTILITGGAGFIGSHLCRRLLNEGGNVVTVDNFNDFYDPAIKRGNIEALMPLGLKLVEADIRDMEAMDRLFSTFDIQTVVHLAAMAGVRPSIQDPVLYNDVNIHGTVNLLEMCRKHGIRRFVFASSSSVYGNNHKVPFSESDNVDFPISPYAATKKAGELLCHTYRHLYGISVACLRFFTVYGPGQRPDLAIHKFTKLLFEGGEIPFYGDGSAERDYTYIDDILDGIIRTMDWIGRGDAQYEIFNLGESNTVSLKRMVETIEKVTGRQANIKRLPMQPGDVDRTFADVTKAKKLLGYAPSMEFEKGVERFVEWYKGMNGFHKYL